MQLIRRPQKFPASRPTAVAIGNFDGFHLGHQAVIARMQALAQEKQLVPAVLTFEPHPRAFFAPHTPAFRLEPLGLKLRRLKEAGVEQVFLPAFNQAFAALEAAQFLTEVLGRQLQAKAVITGENFAFGKNRGGDITLLRQWGAREGVTIDTVPPVHMADGTICSSTAVRMALADGNMLRAQALLGRSYQITGRVLHGDGRGRGLGFPTANLALPAELKLPSYGVYAVRVQVSGSAAYAGRRYAAVANLGVRPTVAATPHPSLEVHLFDFNGELYGARLTVDFMRKLRDEKRFDSLAALTQQIAEDCLQAQTILKQGA